MSTHSNGTRLRVRNVRKSSPAGEVKRSSTRSRPPGTSGTVAGPATGVTARIPREHASTISRMALRSGIRQVARLSPGQPVRLSKASACRRSPLTWISLCDDTIACQEAQHGLGHRQSKSPDQVDAIIQDYLDRRLPTWPDYPHGESPHAARLDARRGNVQ